MSPFFILITKQVKKYFYQSFTISKKLLNSMFKNY